MKLKKLLVCLSYLAIHMKERNPILILIPIFLVLSLIACQTTKSSSLEQTFILEEGIVFGTVDRVELKLDLARPVNGKGPYPALIFIHGGGWRHGNRQGYKWQLELAAKRGYVAVSADYRLTKESIGTKAKYPFPAQLHDVKCAVRWLRANAEQYNIDPEHIGAYGQTVGGHLALLLGLTDSSDGMEGDCGNLNYSSKVQAVINLSGVTDLASFIEEPTGRTLDVIRLVGGTLEEMPEKYKRASPLTYVSKDDPPVLTIYAAQDFIMPPQQSELLDNKMKELGVSHTLIVQEGAEHIVIDLVADYPLWEFFDKHLKN